MATEAELERVREAARQFRADLESGAIVAKRTPITCPSCGGRGRHPTVYDDMPMMLRPIGPLGRCSMCNGTGKWNRLEFVRPETEGDTGKGG